MVQTISYSRFRRGAFEPSCMCVCVRECEHYYVYPTLQAGDSGGAEWGGGANDVNSPAFTFVVPTVENKSL